MELLVNVVNQKLKLATNLKSFVAGTQQFIKLTFNLSDEWDNLLTFAQFIQGENVYSQYLDENNSVYLPHEIQAGTCKVILYGTGSQGEGSQIIATTNYLEFNIDENIVVADASSTEISQSLYDQLVNQFNRIADLSESDYSDLIVEQVGEIMAGYLRDGSIAAATIQDGSIARSKVNTAFESTLAKADNSWQRGTNAASGAWDDTYDTLGRHQDIFNFAMSQAAVIYNGQDGHLDVLRGQVDAARYLNPNVNPNYTVSGTNIIQFSTLADAISGVYKLSKDYTNSALVAYSPFFVTIVNELPQVGNPRTFYLIPKESGNGYDKWWYITNDSGVSFWDNFGSTSTVIISSLNDVESPSEDIDYIVETDSGYLYYKYIDGNWEMIAGSSAEIISPSYTIDYKGYGLPTTNDYTASDHNGKRYLNLTDFKVYLSNGTEWSLVETLAVASELTDYYLNDGSGTYVHYRYINNRYDAIGVSSAEMEALIANTVTPITNRLTTAEGSISTMQTTLNNLSNMVKDVTISDNTLTITYNDNSTTTLEIDTGIDIGAVRYNERDDYYLRFYDSNDNELEDLACYIQGGGGSGSTNAGTAYIARVTDSSVQTIYGDSCNISYKFTAVDASNELVGNGVGTLYVNNVAVETGFDVYNGLSDGNVVNTIDVSDYLVVGSNTVKISVSVDTGGESNTVATKTWSVNAINMYFTWNYADNQINTAAVTDYYTPYGALSKTIYTFIDVNPMSFNPVIVEALPDSSNEDFDESANYFLFDGTDYTHYVWDSNNNQYVSGVGEMLDVTTTTRSGVQQALTIPMQTHGSHSIVRYIIGTVNGVEIKTAQQTHDMIFAVDGINTPIISTSFNTRVMTQYNTVQIPIVVYNPSSTTSTVYLYENGNLVSTWTGVDRSVHYWNYSPTTYGTKTLTITCGETSKSLTIEVEELDIDEAEVSGYDFRFKASEIATNSAAQNWSATTVAGSPVTVTYSNNFDWVNGGLHTEEDEEGHIRQYFAVRAGTTMTINYDLFGQNYDPKQYGKNFKFIFKAVNCRTYDAQVLSCMDSSNGNNGVGLVMTANNAVMTTANETLDTLYCKDTYIEFEANIHPNSEYRYLQFWMDGSHDRTILYSAEDTMQQVNPVGITIGSPNCDVYIYLIKAYPTYLTNENEISNFIMDAPNAFEMVNRYDRNDILNSSGEVDYQKLANKNPDLHIICLDLNRMSTGKKDNVVAHSFRHIYNTGGTSECFTVNNACVTIQGTSSVGYLESAGNVDINFKNNRTFTSDNVEYTTSSIAFDDGTSSTSGYSISSNAIPVDYLNVKLNVASSENCNNACIADWYNTYQPWLSPAKKKNSKARDTMEFVPGVIFIRDRSGNLFGNDTQNYHMYGICDIGNSKKNTKVFHDTTNPLACCVEVANNTSLPCLMSSKTYTWNSKNEAVITENGEEQKVFEFRYEGDMVNKAKSAWDRFVEFMYDHNPNLATNNSLGTSVTFTPYTFKGSGTYNTSNYDSNTYKVVYLYGYGLPNTFGYAATDYITDTTENATCYYYINYSNNQIYSSNGTTWTSIGTLTWTADRNSILAGTTISTYAGTYTTDSFDYRMAYLLEHCEEYMVIDPVIYHFVFIESFLMTDNVAKNTFWSSDDLVHWEPSKDYDNDTALGNDNVGGLSFTYGLETDDTVGSSYVFNAHDAAWITFARGLFDACATMYRNRESAGCFNTTAFLNKTKVWQETRPERVWVADTQRKYLRPYEDNGTETYIDMLAGKKTHQREQVKTYNAYYYASKYVSNSCTTQNIMVRGNTPTSWQGVEPANTATLSMYIDCYIVVASTSYNVVSKVRAKRGRSYVMDFSTIGSMGETELYFCTAPMITELSGLAHLYFKQNNFAMATNLQRLEIGSNVTGYSNPNLESLTIGTNKMLEYLDVRNCPNVSGSLDLSGCVSLKELYLENTAFTGISFANGGLLETAHLPSPTMLTLRRLIYLDDLTINSTNNLTQLIAENCDFDNAAVLTIGSTSTSQGTKDIVLNIVESSSNLSRVRLTGLDWSLAATTLLNTLLGMSGIGDDGYGTQQSVLTGEVYVSGSIRNSELDNYELAWNDLEVTYNSANLITQYLATYVNPDGTVLYQTYVDQGATPPDPVTLGYISMPTQTATAQYTFAYNGWDDITSAMLSARTITAQYTQTIRTYTVTWYAREGLSLGSTMANYGAEVVYNGDLPTDTSGETQYIYKVFTGWNKSTGYITEDTDVYAVWETASTLPPTSKDLSQMTCAEIYGVCQAGMASTYFSDKDHFDITLGSDFTFENVQSEVLLENCFFDGNGHRYENGVEKTNSYIDTSIKLFDADSPSFTLAVDYEFLGTTVNNGCLVSSCVNNDGEGFKLQYNSNPAIKWGDKTVTVGTSVNRNIVVLRHVKGSNTLFVYTYNKGDITYDSAITRTESVRSSKTETSQVLTFGGIRNANGTEHGFYGKGWIYWAKIWYDDLGDTVARKLSSWIHETLRMEYIGANRYLLPNSMSNYANASFLANNTLPLLRRMNPTVNGENTNAGGWAESEMRTFLNTRLFEALPYKWQAVIKQVSVKSSAGGTSYSITTSNDKLYLAANREVGGSTASPYVDEVDVTSTISFFTNDRKRLKFCGVIIRDDAQYIIESTEPTLLTSYTVNEGDIWVNTNNQNIGYIYMSADTIAKHTRIGYRAISNTDNIQASDGGCWVRAHYWWERSPYASNSTNFMDVGIYGYPGNVNVASSGIGVALSFSI